MPAYCTTVQKHSERYTGEDR